MSVGFRTVEDYKAVWGPSYGPIAYEMFRADDPLEMGDTANYRAHAAAIVWANFNYEANYIGWTRKVNGAQSNDMFRIAVARPTTLTEGIAEGGVVPDSKMHTFAMSHVTPKHVVGGPFKTSQYNLWASGRGQAIKWEDVVAMWSRDFMVGLNQDLMTHNGLATYSTLKPTRLDSIIGSTGEFTLCTDADGNAYAAGELDLFNGTIDRDSGVASWRDAVVLHNSAVDRAFNLGLMRDLETAVARNSGKLRHPSQAWLTGYNGHQRLSEELVTYQRFSDVVFDVTSVEGVPTPSGRRAGFQVNSFDNMPVLFTQHCPADTLDRFYLLDRDYLFLNVQAPINYYQAGYKEGQTLLTKEFTEEGMFDISFEQVCTFLGSQGKLRDLM